jgi:hypothetical protein
VTG